MGPNLIAGEHRNKVQHSQHEVVLQPGLTDNQNWTKPRRW